MVEMVGVAGMCFWWWIGLWMDLDILGGSDSSRPKVGGQARADSDTGVVDKTYAYQCREALAPTEREMMTRWQNCWKSARSSC